MCWDNPVFGKAFPHIGLPRYVGMHTHIRVPRYMEMHSHILGYPGMWERIPTYWGTPVYGNALPSTGVPRYIGKHSHIFGYPSIWECTPIYLDTPLYAFPCSVLESACDSTAPNCAHGAPFRCRRRLALGAVEAHALFGVRA